MVISNPRKRLFKVLDLAYARIDCFGLEYYHFQYLISQPPQTSRIRYEVLLKAKFTEVLIQLWIKWTLNFKSFVTEIYKNFFSNLRLINQKKNK